jgi:peptide chain release factor 1
MIPIKKVQDIIARHSNLEKELSSGDIDTKLFAKKSKEYSSLGNIISFARDYVKFESEKKDLEQIIQDKNNDSEIFEMAEKDLNELKVKKQNYENKLKIFLASSSSFGSKNIFSLFS